MKVSEDENYDINEIKDFTMNEIKTQQNISEIDNMDTMKLKIL